MNFLAELIYSPLQGEYTLPSINTNNNSFNEGTGIVERSSLRKVELETGTILQIRELPAPYFGEEITIYGNRVIQLTRLSKVGFVYDKNSFELLQGFNYSTEGWGIIHDGKRFIMSDGTSKLHFLDPFTFENAGLKYMTKTAR